jgi:hypothetical protein
MKGWSLSSPVRINPFTGLIVDVDTWATAHDYHRRHHQLHLLALHGSGIACGLEVLPTDPPSDTLIVEAGIAVDGLGTVIVLPERQRIIVEASEGTVYVVLDYVESLPPTTSASQQDARGRVVEDFRLRLLPALPESPALELARVQVAASPKLVLSGPSNPWLPGLNEIDSRFRFRAEPQTPREISVGLLVCGPAEELDASHQKGFCYFLREVHSAGLRCVLVGTEGGDVPPADILYVTGNGGTKPSAAVVNRVSDQLKRGAWLFVDTCGAGTDLVEGLRGAIKDDKKAAAETEESALGAHFVFGTAPPGASASGGITWAYHAVISSRDYGCAWAGRHGKQALSREQTRSALEFGVNVAVCASRGASPL